MLARLKVTLTLEGPVLSRASAPAAPGIDSPVARGPGDHPILPFSLVRGRLRQAWEEIGPAIGMGRPRLEELLGRASGDADGDWQPHAGRLAFSDFVAARKGGSQVDASVALDDARRAAEEGALRHLELPFLAGEKIDFLGEVRFLARGAEDAAKVAGDLEKGLRWIPFFGSERTVGFGRALGVATQLETRIPPEPELKPDSAEVWLPLLLRFQSSFCLAQRPEGGNLFEGAEVVPGGALKGTLARTLQRLCGLAPGAEIAGNLPAPFVELGRHFGRLRFTHAFPSSPDGPRPCVLPLSTVAGKAENGTDFYDLALCRGPLLIGGAAPTFAIDWKESQTDKIREELGWPKAKPRRELRLRTAISRAERRAADELLFGYEAVCPGDLVWRAAVDLEEVPPLKRPAVVAELRVLLDLGLQGIGKTAAEALVEVGPGQPVLPLESAIEAIGEGDERVFVLALQTPALLADPGVLGEAAGDRRLFAAYAAAWHDLSGGELSLRRFFSQERLAGGYLTERFRRARGSGEKAYRPYFLTETGSVFVLAADDETKAGSLLARWARLGLELPSWAKERYGDSWKTNPFTRQDGYGEVAVNLDWHRDRRPPAFEEIPWNPPSAT